MAENYRTALIWNLMKKNPHVVRGVAPAPAWAAWRGHARLLPADRPLPPPSDAAFPVNGCGAPDSCAARSSRDIPRAGPPARPASFLRPSTRRRVSHAWADDGSSAAAGDGRDGGGHSSETDRGVGAGTPDLYPRVITMEPELIVRESTARAAGCRPASRPCRRITKS